MYDNQGSYRLTRRQIALCFAVFALAGCNRRNVPQVTLYIASDSDELAFRPDRLSCPAGAHVQLFFHHAGKILSDPHDWVLLAPGHLKAFLADADKAPDDTVIPANDEPMVLAATPLCGKQHTVMVEFIAPVPGNYDFVCSIAGHGETMRGILTVTA